MGRSGVVAEEAAGAAGVLLGRDPELVAERMVETPLLFVVEDAHWLDRPSSEVLKFVARRVEADQALLLFSVREGVSSAFDDAGLPELHLAGLDQEASNALLDLGA